MTMAEREELIKENSRLMNTARDLDFPWLENDCKDVPPIEECEDYVPPESQRNVTKHQA